MLLAELVENTWKWPDTVAFSVMCISIAFTVSFVVWVRNRRK